MSFGSSHLAVGDPLGDRFWLSPKKGEWQSAAAGQCPEADVDVRSGCGHCSGQQLCNNRRALHSHENVLFNSHRRIFFSFVFPFRLPLRPSSLRCLHISSLGCGVIAFSALQLFTERCNEGAEGCFKFDVPYSLRLGKFRNTMRVLSSALAPAPGARIGSSGQSRRETYCTVSVFAQQVDT